jgi:hypothetical protein
MLSIPRGMPDGEDNDFLVRLIDRVLNEIGILSGDQLAYALNGLLPSNLWKQTRVWSESKMAVRTR